MTSLHIVVAPLDWGLGHASRCVPLIEFFQKQGHVVKVLCGPKNKAFLETEVPGISTVDFPSYQIHLPNSNVAFSLIKQSFKIARKIKEEKKELDRWLEDNPCDLIVSDNRYGIFHSEIKSVLITHQLHVMAPLGLNKFPRKKIAEYLKNFDEVWIPDDPDFRLAGSLSDKMEGMPCRYLGVLSRFKKSVSPFVKMEYEWMALISGPETQRTIFQNEVFSLFKKSGRKALIVCGLPEEKFEYIDGNITVVSHLNTAELHDMISRSGGVISRSGYSTIMDLCALNKSAVLVPTPGQTEQEYLGNYLSEKGLFKRIKPSEIQDLNLLEISGDITGVKIDSRRFEVEISDFLNKNFTTDG